MKLPRHIKIYGDTSFRDKNCRQEATEQKEFFGILKELYPHFYRIAIHPKNEGKRTYHAAAIDADSGALNKGAADIIIPCRFAFVCEMKRADHTLSSISKHQIEYLEAAQEQGAFACIALGCAGALMALKEWLLLK